MTSLNQSVNQTNTAQPLPNQTRDRQDQVRARRAFKITGFLHLFLGFIIGVTGGLAFIWFSLFSNIGMPIWGACVFFIPTGMLGLLSLTYYNRGMIIAYLVLNVFCILQSTALVTWYSLALVFDVSQVRVPVVTVILDGCILVFSILEGINSTVGASFTCASEKMTCGCVCCPDQCCVARAEDTTMSYSNDAGMTIAFETPRVTPLGEQGYYVMGSNAGPTVTGIPPHPSSLHYEQEKHGPPADLQAAGGPDRVPVQLQPPQGATSMGVPLIDKKALDVNVLTGTS